MTLTSSDLQAIDKIVTKRVEPLEKKLGVLENGQSKLEKGQASLVKGQASLEKGQRKIQKDLKIVINSFDTEYLGLKKRVAKIENHLNLRPSEF